MSGSEMIRIRCSRCIDVPITPVPSVRSLCEVCGEEVWVSQSTRDLLAKRYPESEARPVCMACHVPGEEGAVLLTAEQVHTLRDQGFSDMTIIYTLAVAEAAGGDATLEEAATEIRDFPYGERAQRYRAALPRVVQLVGLTPPIF